MVWLVLAVIVAVLLLVDWWFKDENIDLIPGPKGLFLFGNAFEHIMTHEKLFTYMLSHFNTYKGIFKVKVGPKRMVALYDPEDVETVISGTRNMKKGFLYSFIEPWLKEGLLLSHGEKWHQRRRLLTPAFHFRILQHFKSALLENAEKLAQKLGSELDKPYTNIESYLNDFTLESICETAMGVKLDAEALDSSKRYKDGINTLAKLVIERSTRVWMHPNLIFYLTKLGKKQTELIDLLKSFRESVVTKRRKAKVFEKFDFDNDDKDCDDDNTFIYEKKRMAMLDLLLQKETHGEIDADGVSEEVDIFIFAGHDTTSRALQFTFMLLANHPDWQDKVVEEIKQVIGTSDREITMNDLSQLKLLECCIKESLRLYPPVAFFMRQLDHDVKLKNYLLPTGTDVTIVTYQLHRLQDQFVEPLQFRPERFLKEPTWHPYSYIPFSAGPRNCIGQKFAMMEMKLALSSVLRRYRLLPVTKPQDIILVVDFLIDSLHPIRVRFEKRV